MGHLGKWMAKDLVCFVTLPEINFFNLAAERPLYWICCHTKGSFEITLHLLQTRFTEQTSEEGRKEKIRRKISSGRVMVLFMTRYQTRLVDREFIFCRQKLSKVKKSMFYEYIVLYFSGHCQANIVHIFNVLRAVISNKPPQVTTLKQLNLPEIEQNCSNSICEYIKSKQFNEEI